MPFPLAIPLIAAGASVAGSIINNIGQRRAQKLANEQNVKYWNLQNDYNSPTAQMQRLRSAGMNPAMMYGQSASGATGAASSIAPSKAAPRENALSGQNLSMFSQIANTEAQTDNLRRQNTVLIQEAALKAAQTANETFKGRSSKISAELAEELKQTSLETARENLGLIQARQTETESRASGISQQNTIRAQTMGDQINRIKYDAAVAAETLKGKELENALKAYEVQLNNIYMNQKDPRVKAALMFIQSILNRK